MYLIKLVVIVLIKLHLFSLIVMIYDGEPNYKCHYYKILLKQGNYMTLEDVSIKMGNKYH